MSLNTEAMDDIQGDADYLTTDEGKSAKDGTVRIIADDHLDVNVPKDIDEAVSALDGYDIQIQTTKDDIVKIRELDELSGIIMAQETISQSDAEEVERVYGGLYDNVAQAREYTQSPSSVNLKETKAYMATALKETTESAISRHREYLTKTYEHAMCLLTCLNEKLIQETLGEFDELREQSRKDIASAAVSTNFLVYTAPLTNDAGEETSPPRLVDLKKVRLYGELKEGYVIPSSLACLPSNDDIRMLREVFHSDPIRRLMRESNLFQDVLESLHRDYHNTNSSNREFFDLSYLDLLLVFVSGKIEEYLTKAFKALNEVSEKMAEVVPVLIANEVTEVGKEVAWSESALAVSDFYEKLMNAEKFRMATYMLMYRAKPILDGFRKAL